VGFGKTTEEIRYLCVFIATIVLTPHACSVNATVPVHAKGVPPRVEYEVTELGRTLVPLVMALAEWAMANHEQINANRSRHRSGLPR
jgi:hypothetical protein